MEYSSVSGFKDDPSIENIEEYNKEMERRMAVKRLMREVLRPLVKRLLENQVHTCPTKLLQTCHLLL
jgi:hypothetical protein